ncbi:hypothetical protein E2C01_085411 [Portunus trituberculatus]|uniref:Uncharacterized protein n=1 Tax=Portunus trituberculatus TaxID=210409 RepID=A0A5B7J7I6_PORTR|nr:hypothetical protein [Portunus trituberculatus]
MSHSGSNITTEPSMLDSSSASSVELLLGMELSTSTTKGPRGRPSVCRRRGSASLTLTTLLCCRPATHYPAPLSPPLPSAPTLPLPAPCPRNVRVTLHPSPPHTPESSVTRPHAELAHPAAAHTPTPPSQAALHTP